MSVLVAIRIPEGLVEKIDARGKRTAVILEAVRLLFGEVEEKPLPAVTKIEREVAKAETVKRPRVGAVKTEPAAWRPNSQCPHGYMNSFVCSRMGGGC